MRTNFSGVQWKEPTDNCMNIKKYHSEQWHGWMLAALEGDKSSYRLLLEQLKLWLVAFYSSRLPVSEVDDLVQETLLTIHQKRHTFDVNQAFGPWFTAVAKHRWIDHLRKVGRLNETPFDEVEIDLVLRVDYSTSHDVMALLANLPKAQADVIRLVKLQELSLQETSDKTGHSVSSIKVMIHRGMKKLQKLAKDNTLLTLN